MNSTILSYNKINQVQEQIPLELPDSYIFEEKKSAQKLIPDLYDLDRLEGENIVIQRNSTPNLSSKNGLRRNYFNSVLMDISLSKNYNTNKVAQKVMQPNIYSNYEDVGIESLKEEKDFNNSNNIDIKNEEIHNIYQNESHKINDDIINNINIKKNIIIKSNKKDDYLHAKSGIYNQNLNIDMNSTFKDNINNLNSNKKNKLFDKSIKSDFNAFNFGNIMKKDPNKNIITINTSLYKPRKRMSTFFSNNNSINDKSKNSINNFLKFEEESNNGENSLEILNKKSKNNINNKITNKKNLKEEVLKSFHNSNSIFDLSNNSHLEQEKSSQSKLNDMISYNNSYLNMDEKDNIIKKNILNHIPNNIAKKNSLNNYNFKTERNNIQRNSQQNNNNINTRFSAMSSRKFNFDYPKKIIAEELSKDNEDIKSNGYIENKSKKNRELNPFKPLVKMNLKNFKKIIKNNGLFNILTFLDDDDLISLLKSNKQLISLINKSIADAYYLRIKKNLLKFKHIFELLKCSLIYTKIKDSFKIDFVINIRFINPSKIYANINEEELLPKCYQILFFYQCYKPLEPNAKLKTKENTKKVKMYDYYTFDLYPNRYQFPSIYITKESQ